jgi:hypothetical protein
MADRPPTPDPTAEDPYVPGAPEAPGGEEPSAPTEGEKQALDYAKKDPTGENGPSYERNQDPEDTTGGSTDPHNTLTHADSGNES